MEPEKFGYSTVAKYLKQAAGRKRRMEEKNIEYRTGNIECRSKV
jgi:hypothetical protein